jgi:hypothetical protein
MAQFEYKCIEVPMTFLEVATKRQQVNPIEEYGKFISKEAVAGWELDRIDTITSKKSGGCLTPNAGTETQRKILIFRRSPS